MAAEPHPDAQALLELREDAPPMEEIPIAQIRSRPLPEGEPDAVADVTDVIVRENGVGIPVRLYTPSDSAAPVIVWAHGGGSVLGSIESEEPAARALANATGCIVASVEYRLSPEHPFPAALRDFMAVLEWVDTTASDVVPHSGKIVTGGQSAGGKLASATAHYVRDHGGPAIDYQVLIYPSVNYSMEFPSYEEYDGYFLTREDIAYFQECYLGDSIHGHNPYAFPLEDSTFGDLPPATVVTAGFDPLKDACIEYANRLSAAGVPVEHHHYADMIHAFFGNVLDPEWERAREAMADVGADVTDFFA